MLDEERKAIARRAHDAINQRNVELLDGHPGYWETRQVFPLLFTAFPDLSSTVEQQTVEGEWVTTRATMRGTQLGAFMGIAPTGKAVEIMHISIDQIAEGHVVEHFGVSDWLRALMTFEILPTQVIHKGACHMATQENKATVRRFYEEVINQQKLAILDDLLGDTFVNHDLPSTPAALKSFIAAFHAAFPDGQITIDQMIAEGDTVALRATFQGTQTGKLQDIPPTGKAVTIPALDMYRMVDGKIVEAWGGPNQFSLLQQLGVIPPSPAM